LSILNRHERIFDAPADTVGALMDTLASSEDRLWPRQAWPRMRFDRPLEVGARGGHGPIRYFIEAYEPGRQIRFRFTAPKGFEGTHAYHVEALDANRTRLAHVLEMKASGTVLFTWPLIFRPLHDALIEDSLDCAERALMGKVAAPNRWSLYVRCLRRLLAVRLGRRR
jgi:hypothetical protein